MIIPSDNQNEFKIEQIKDINMHMIDIFEQARLSKADDPELYVIRTLRLAGRTRACTP